MPNRRVNRTSYLAVPEVVEAAVETAVAAHPQSPPEPKRRGPKPKNPRQLTSFMVVGWKRGTPPKTRIVKGYSEGQVLRDLREQYPSWNIEVKAAKNERRNPSGEVNGYHCELCNGIFHRSDSRVGLAHSPELLKAHIEKTWGQKEG